MTKLATVKVNVKENISFIRVNHQNSLTDTLQDKIKAEHAKSLGTEEVDIFV